MQTMTEIRDDPGVTKNPYWEIVRRLPGDDITLRYQQRWEPRSYPMRWPGDHGPGREDLVWRYAWAIPDPASLAFVAAHADGGILEPGAGAGYWAWQLSQLGVTVLAYDQRPPDQIPNRFHLPRHRTDTAGHVRPVFHPVAEGGPEVAAGGQGMTLLLCWPPYSAPFADEALRHYPGDQVVFIGEGEGGCNADDMFFRQLDQAWEEVATHQPVQWWGIHDWITVYRRR